MAKKLFSDAEDLDGVLQQLAGYASVCWDDDGVFLSEQALEGSQAARERLVELGLIRAEGPQSLTVVDYVEGQSFVGFVMFDQQHTEAGCETTLAIPTSRWDELGCPKQLVVALSPKEA